MTNFLTVDMTYFIMGMLPKKKMATGRRVVNDNPAQPVWAVYSEYHFEFMNILICQLNRNKEEGLFH